MLEIKHRILKKGPCSKIFFSIVSGGSKSDEKIIDYENSLALVQFKFKNTAEDGGSHVVYVKMMKHASERDSTVRMSVTCKTTTIQSQCGWTLLGRNVVAKEHDVFLSDLEVYVYLYKMKIVGFTNLYEDTDLTDFKLSSPDGCVTVHKACLAAHSDCFKRMLIGQWKETLEGCIEIKGVNLSTLQLLKKYMYMGSLPEEPAELRLLLIIAAQYLMDNLKTECIMKLAQSVLPEDFYSLHDLACGYNIPELTIAMANMTPEDIVSEAYQLKMKKDIKQSP